MFGSLQLYGTHCFWSPLNSVHATHFLQRTGEQLLKRPPRSLKPRNVESFVSEFTNFALTLAAFRDVPSLDACHVVLKTLFRKWPLSDAVSGQYLDQMIAVHQRTESGTIKQEIGCVLKILDQTQLELEAKRLRALGWGKQPREPRLTH